MKHSSSGAGTKTPTALRHATASGTPGDLPTPAELEDFTAYDARMNEISLDDVDFDSELQKLLDGGFGDAPEEK